MGVERICKSCKTWNKDNDKCINCGAIISPKLITKIKEKIRKKAIKDLPPSSFDVFLEKWKNSNYFIVKVLYHIIYSIGTVFFAIAAFLTYLAAIVSA